MQLISAWFLYAILLFRNLIFIQIKLDFDKLKRNWVHKVAWVLMKLILLNAMCPFLLLLLSRFSRSDSVRPHRWQPTRLPRPWDSPGKNTGVGCHFLLQCMKVKSEREVAQSCPIPSNPLDYSPPGSSIHGIFQARVLEWGAIAFSRKVIYSCLLQSSDSM